MTIDFEHMRATIHEALEQLEWDEPIRVCAIDAGCLYLSASPEDVSADSTGDGGFMEIAELIDFEIYDAHEMLDESAQQDSQYMRVATAMVEHLRINAAIVFGAERVGAGIRAFVAHHRH